MIEIFEAVINSKDKPAETIRLEIMATSDRLEEIRKEIKKKAIGSVLKEVERELMEELSVDLRYKEKGE